MLIDTVLTGFTAHTMDPACPTARKIGVHHGRIVALDEQLEGVRARRTVDLLGACVVPGFNDAHNHMALYGLTRRELDLSDTRIKTLDDLYDAVAERARATREDQWLMGFGYDQNRLGGHPHRSVLDRIAPRHRVWLRHASGHLAVVNSRVLDGIGPSAADRAAAARGRIVTDGDGRPTGLVEEGAIDLVRSLTYPHSTAELTEAVVRAARDYLREGVTSCTEAGVGTGWVGHSPVEAAAYQQARAMGALDVRVQLMVAHEALRKFDTHAADPAGAWLDLGLHSGFGDHWLRLGAVKIFADGSLSGRTAALSRSYAGAPGRRGELRHEAEELTRHVVRAHATGWQVAVHALGDRAIDAVLDAFEAAQRAYPRADARPRIEHCGLARPDQLNRLRSLGVVPVPQPVFVERSGSALVTGLGPERAGWAHRQRSFLDAGLTVPGSSDRPIAPGAPLRGIHAMVNRTTDTGDVLGRDEAVSPWEALYAYTMGSARAGFDEGVKGSIEPGKLADLVVLERDPTVVPPETIKDIGVLATMVDGRFVYDSMGFVAGGEADERATSPR
ncbi:amidohydrolase [Kitasatospora sp. NPDC101235]|uniref:amidohydrolase n=1 Tax=Kitasatospora sp. NPDC101235 TaxID=3364101 RepID=UPI0037F75E59